MGGRLLMEEKKLIEDQNIGDGEAGAYDAEGGGARRTAVGGTGANASERSCSSMPATTRGLKAKAVLLPCDDDRRRGLPNRRAILDEPATNLGCRL